MNQGRSATRAQSAGERLRPAVPRPGTVTDRWRARDAAEMQAIPESLPLSRWMTAETTSLNRHPSDPAIARS
jgi:muconolactone delta-isomerase